MSSGPQIIEAPSAHGLFSVCMICYIYLFIIRAATYIKLGKLDLADIDCKKSISLKPDYARAHGRLG